MIGSMRIAVVGFVLLALAGCAAPLRVAQLPTDEQRCEFGGGVFRFGLCDYCR